MQLLATFKKILYMEFRATFNFRKFKVALVFLAGHSVAMVTYRVTKLIPTCSPTIGQFFDTMIVAAINKEWF